MDTMVVKTSDSGDFAIDLMGKKLKASLCKYVGGSCHFYLGSVDTYKVALVVFRFCETLYPYDKGKWASSWIVVDESTTVNGQVKACYSSSYKKDVMWQSKNFQEAWAKAFNPEFFEKGSLGDIDANAWCDFKQAVEGLKGSSLDALLAEEGGEEKLGNIRTVIANLSSESF